MILFSRTITMEFALLIHLSAMEVISGAGLQYPHPLVVIGHPLAGRFQTAFSPTVMLR